LPAYHLPTLGNVLRSMWERGWSFIKKAGTVILLSSIVVWFLSFFGWTEEGFRMLAEDEIDLSILARIGSAIAWIFTPLGWGNWQAAVASFTGLVAKENIVGTMGILYRTEGHSVYYNLGQAFTGPAGFSFLVFNLLCAPCFAAMGAIRREMNNGKWTAFAIAYECVFAYIAAFVVYQIANIFTGSGSIAGFIIALLLVAGSVYLLVRPYKESEHLTVKVG
ncbi:MAG: ferrous iron transporter B, partial [Lachnospiraceae bacterium]|nr:ferrous iron transporter B [Lachnospiraceae bacterium]